MKYQKKPIIVDAEPWHGFGTGSKNIGVVPFQNKKGLTKEFCDDEYCQEPMSEHGWIATLEGGHIVCPGDWIITGIEGEKYPCKSRIFVKTYELVKD